MNKGFQVVMMRGIGDDGIQPRKRGQERIFTPNAPAQDSGAVVRRTPPVPGERSQQNAPYNHSAYRHPQVPRAPRNPAPPQGNPFDVARDQYSYDRNVIEPLYVAKHDRTAPVHRNVEVEPWYWGRKGDLAKLIGFILLVIAAIALLVLLFFTGAFDEYRPGGGW